MMQQWETRTECVGKTESVEKITARLGLEGWEPWALHHYLGFMGGLYVYFKRPKKN